MTGIQPLFDTARGFAEFPRAPPPLPLHRDICYYRWIMPPFVVQLYTHAPLARWCPTLIAMRDMGWYARYCISADLLQAHSNYGSSRRPGAQNPGNSFCAQAAA
jgi:hypothetical protein